MLFSRSGLAKLMLKKFLSSFSIMGAGSPSIEKAFFTSSNEKSFSVSSKNVKFRKCVVTKQNTLFYHYNEKHIVVVAVFDTRQNPKKLKI